MSSGVNPNLKLKAKKLHPLDYYLEGLAAGDRYILSEALTLIESRNPIQRKLGESILVQVGGQANRSIRVGITGSPGAGKSTMIEALGTYLADQGKRVAVLAVDPSSTRSQGSILGDKTRMSTLSVHDNAFVRPTASANVLGGVARATRESIAMCEAAGYEIILIESVGVGQSETELAEMVDAYMLVLLPGGGDGVQGIKRGVVELADLMVINKYDGDRKIIAEQSRRDFGASIRLFQHELLGWQVPISLCSAIELTGIDSLWDSVQAFIKKSKTTSFFLEKRKRQDQKWVKAQSKIELMAKAEELFAIESHSDAAPKEGSIFEEFQRIKSKIETEYLRLRDK